MGRLLPTRISTRAPSPAVVSAATASGSQYKPATMPVSPASTAAIRTSMVSHVPPDMQLSPWSSNSTGLLAPPASSAARARESARGSLS
ncbi:hypothetical protein G6F35_018332 [Rhizopus arrhizus]|nr:hypothetical protein G6F35_018332 [Rhizopus arrhizus]